MTLIQEACKYAQRGWKVFPLSHNSKKPLTGTSGFKDATDDLESICNWDDNWNLGVATGSASGFWVLDIDIKGKHNGIKSLEKLIAQYGGLPETLVQRTPSGGWHYFFKMDDRALRNTAGAIPGIDTRADGGYIVAPPSSLNSSVYKWMRETPILSAPEWLYDELSKAKEASNGEIKLEEGSRNNSFFKIASSLRGKGLKADEIYTLLLEKNTECKPPLDHAEIKNIAYSAGTRYKPNTTIGGLEGLEPFDANGRSPGQIALEMLYSDGVFISVNNELFEYKDGYYQAVDEGAELIKVSDLFDRCITGKSGQRGYARTQQVREAINHVKSKFYVPHELTKCKGLNVKNGVIKPRYLPNGDVDFDLHPHSPFEYFLFQADFEYRPDLDTTELDRLLDAMLDSEPLIALLRNISAVIDMNTVRSKFTRVLKALILNGEGSNGKDSLRTWCQLLLGKTAFSNISVQVFKRADSAREFQINSLAHSRINWCSENSKVAMDNCQMIKQIITGDPIILEQKHKEPFTIEPEIVMIFNANKVPAFESLSEAMQSRYAIIPFPYVFKDKPDPNRAYEKKADSRLKYNPEFLKEYVLPAFLNRLLLEFKLLLKEGIDYTFQESTMDQIRKDNNHIYEFIEDVGVIECDPKDGITSGELYNLYCQWGIKENYIITNNFGDVIKYSHPNEQYDRIPTSKKQLTNRLKELFPRLKHGRTKKERTISLKIRGEPLDDAPF